MDTRWFWLVISIAVLIAVALTVLGRARFSSGRATRLAQIGRLTAHVSASWLGAWLRRLFAGKERRHRIDQAQREANARRVVETMGHMKGAFMKVGQMLSFVSDDIPKEYRAALQSLQASAPPMDFPVIRDVAERELGMPLERAFARFDTTPLASASIGQVHRAQLPTGEEVVVKVQYPGVSDAIRNDLNNAAVLYRLVGMFYPGLDPAPIVEELRARITEELDYVNEARNQALFAELYHQHPFIRIPKVFPSHSTGRVLTSEFVAGRTFAEILEGDEAARSRYGEILFRFVFGSILRLAIFNADPHPGNYLFDADGRMVFLDFGCVKYFPEGMLADWRGLVARHLGGDRDEFRKKLVNLGFIPADSNLDTQALYGWFGYFYEPIRDDQPFTFSREYNARSLKVVFSPEGEMAGLQKRLNVPRDFVFVNRIQWGVYSILSQLEATANWHRVYGEYLHGLPPATELGERDAAHWEAWRKRHGVATTNLLLRPGETIDDLRARQ